MLPRGVRGSTRYRPTDAPRRPGRHRRRGRRDLEAHREGGPDGRPLRAGRARRAGAGGGPPGRGAAPGPARGGVGDAERRRRRAGRRAVAHGRARSTARSTRLADGVGARVGGRAVRRAARRCSAGSTEPEVAFLRRLLGGELRQGALAGVMADARGQGRRRAADRGAPGRHARRATSAAAAAAAQDGGRDALEAVGLKVGRPVQPMLASHRRRRSPTPSRRPASVGRVEARRHPHPGPPSTATTCAIYTRNLNDITDRLPEVVDAGAVAARPTPSCSTARPSGVDADGPPATCSRTR